MNRSEWRAYFREFRPKTFTALRRGYRFADLRADAIAGLKTGLESMAFADANFRQSPLIRLHTLRGHLTDGRLDSQLHWRT